jgi:Protein of unknown function (DUF3617)
MTTRNQIVGLVSLACIGGMIAASASAFEIRRGEWEATVDVTYADASPVTIKTRKAVDDLEAQLRSLGVTPEPRPPEEKRFIYSVKECTPASAQGLGWIDLEAIISPTNWSCRVTNRVDLGSSIQIDFVCPEDQAKGRLELNFTTDSSVTGRFERTDMSGRTLYESATVTGGLSRADAQCGM